MNDDNSPIMELVYANGQPIQYISMGINWESKKKGFFGSQTLPIDLDAMALLFKYDKKLSETVCFLNPKSSDRAVLLSDDDREGDTHGLDADDNETISIDLYKLAPKINYIVLLASRWDGGDFEDIPSAALRVYVSNPVEPDYNLVEYTIQNDRSFKSAIYMLLGVLVKNNERWFFRQEGECLPEVNIKDAIERIIKNAL